MTQPKTNFISRFWQNKPIRWSLLGILMPISGAVTAYAVTEPMPVNEVFKAERVVEELPAVYVDAATFQGSYWTEEVAQNGDSLADILTRLNVPADSIKKILGKAPTGSDVKQLPAGLTVSIRLDSMGDATDIQFFNDDDNGEKNLVAIEKVNGKWQGSTSALETEALPSLRSVVVKTSARGALAQAGVPVEVRESLNELFGDIVSLDSLSSGDSIRLLYNSLYFRGQEIATGDIVAAEITKSGKTYQAYYFDQGDEQQSSYYDQNGKPLKQNGFINQPVQYSRISSPYGVRFHPVLRTVKMHTGIDYAAPSGTPIYAPADGVIVYKGWKGGYGHTVMLQHSNGAETLYAHMSAYAPGNAGATVRAGSVIGYVGSTGRSTGPHLHYEVRVNGQHVNPATLALPTPKLNTADMAKFRSQQAAASGTLAAVRNLPVTVAQLD